MEESANSPAAPFNAAIDCLMRVSRLITKIEKVSTEYILYTEIVGVKLSAGQAQHIKHRLVKQLILQAIPLLSSGVRKVLWNRACAVVPKVKVDINSKTGNSQKSYEMFDDTVDNELDMIVFDIEEDLQDKGRFFMPPRKDPSKSVLRH